MVITTALLDAQGFESGPFGRLVSSSVSLASSSASEADEDELQELVHLGANLACEVESSYPLKFDDQCSLSTIHPKSPPPASPLWSEASNGLVESTVIGLGLASCSPGVRILVCLFLFANRVSLQQLADYEVSQLRVHTAYGPLAASLFCPQTSDDLLTHTRLEIMLPLLVGRTKSLLFTTAKWAFGPATPGSTPSSSYFSLWSPSSWPPYTLSP